MIFQGEGGKRNGKKSSNVFTILETKLYATKLTPLPKCSNVNQIKTKLWICSLSLLYFSSIYLQNENIFLG